jgi:hypothetical protein
MILEIIGFLIIGLSIISPIAATSLAILGATLVLYGMGNKILSTLRQNQPS